MMMSRLALTDHAIGLPDLGPRPMIVGACLPDHIAGLTLAGVHPVQSSFLASQIWHRAGYPAAQDMPSEPTGAIVVLPRAKKEAQHVVSQAVSHVPGDAWVIVDGQKADGVESILKAVTKLIGPVQTYAKAHGKCFWFKAGDAAALRDWHQSPAEVQGDWITAPGVFSADGVDPASEFLVASLPELHGVVIDLGAGWGYLSSAILRSNPKVTRLHLVEDNAVALACAQRNVTGDKAQFHWTDAASWAAPEKADWVVMNPPFHIGRAATPDLGQSFIRKAAGVLKPGGRLIMVANAHLPYEDTLAEVLHAPQTLARTGRFKVLSGDARRKAPRNR